MEEKNERQRSPLERLVEPMLAWYRENARDLPWRRTEDAYRIWVSEIMLQQTRVTAVLGYYYRFLAVFPTVESLAASSSDTLMKCWEGLGYYSRARNLQRAAQIVAEQYGGRFPESYDALLALPGIGDYTASAIASAAFGKREAAVDGNVLRVVARLTDCYDDVLQPATRKHVRAALAAVIPTKPQRIRIFNQATMELGALVCVPTGPPKCEICPAEAFCLARRRGTAEDLPVRAKKKPRQIQDLTVFLLERDGKVALRRRSEKGLLAGLWEFPNVPGVLAESPAGQVVERWGLEPLDWREKLIARHIFTHREWHMTGYLLQVSGEGPADFNWVDGAALARCAVPSAFAKYYQEAQRLLASRAESI